MMGLKPERRVVYGPDRWRLLDELRARAEKVMSRLASAGQPSLVYGSVARGDVDERSDVDVVILRPRLPASTIEMILREELGDPARREITQATPSSAVKGYIHFDGNVVVSLPLTDLGEREEEFYRFGGCLDLEGIRNRERTPGVSKELMLILPTPEGHAEVSVWGKEEVVARVLGISVGTVEERVRVLTERRIRGKTGLYVHYTLGLDESFEGALKRLASVKKGLRRKLGELF